MAVLQAYFAEYLKPSCKRSIRLIHFMIDFENIGSRGLQGAEYLQPDDFVTIFYSQSCMKIEKRRFCQVKESGCDFQICKLQKPRKNALDFYIASRIGEIYGQGYTGMTAIVSNDTGFQAVREYWKNCAAVSREIILRPDIEQCIAVSEENSFRQRRICQERQEIRLEEEYEKYAEQQRIRKSLEESFTHTCYEDFIEQIMNLTESPKPLRNLYRDFLKQFGRKDGLNIYREVKQIL